MLTRVIWHRPWSGMPRELALLVMDELRIYRRRQDANVAMLYRRVQPAIRQLETERNKLLAALLETLQNRRRALAARAEAEARCAASWLSSAAGAESAPRPATPRTGRVGEALTGITRAEL